MNQFKKAKQLRSESGQVTESITDLTTAGVTQKSENIKTPVPDEKPATQEIQEPSTHEKTPVQNTKPSITDDKNTLDNIESTTPNETEKIISKNNIPSVPEEIIYSQNTVDINTPAKTEITEQKNSAQLQAHTTDNTFIPVEPSIIEPAQNSIYNQPLPQPAPDPITEPLYENVMPDSTIPLTQELTENNQDAIVMVPQQVNTPIVQKTTTHNYTAPIVYEPSSPQSVVMQPLPESQPSQEIATAPQTRGRKKAAPNIFAPKGEAKSMRKSLVLKPTSVKIAEDYCNRNGGSFNELIQTLLDNFIDEYGL